MKNEKRNLVFLHMPRSAGITLDQIVKRQYSKDEIFTLVNNEESIKELKKLLNNDKRRIKCINGHYPYGAHLFLDGQTEYITLLRDPVSRMISHYYATINRSHHYLHQKVVDGNISIEEYMSGGLSTEMRNGQTQLLLGWEGEVPLNSDDSEGEKYLRQAKQTLDSFAAVGIVEQFDESLILFKRKLGWKNILYITKNKGVNKPGSNSLSPGVIDIINKYNNLDKQIYEYGKVIFEKMKTGEGISFYIEVKLFKFINFFYNLTDVVYMFLKKIISKR